MCLTCRNDDTHKRVDKCGLDSNHPREPQDQLTERWESRTAQSSAVGDAVPWGGRSHAPVEITCRIWPSTSITATSSFSIS
jgi:hypothetical protein